MSHSKDVLALCCVVASLAALGGCREDAPGWPVQCAVPVGDSPARGPADAWVTAVEFGDFQCPYCREATDTVRAVDTERPELVRWVFKHLTMPYHARAVPAAIAAECAREQGRFWEMHDTLFAHQSALGDEDLVTYANQLGLDMPAWEACLGSDVPRTRIAVDEALADEVAVSYTPTFFVNGATLVGAPPYADLLNAVDRASAEAEVSGVAAADYYASLEAKGCGE